MTPEVLAAVVGAVGVVAGSLITAFGPTLAQVLRRGGPNRDLLGEWVCTWEVLDPPDRARTIRDTVTVERVRGEEIRARGDNTEAGPYRLVGRAAQSGMLTFYYEGLGSRRTLGGVAVVELSATRDSVDGRWHGYDSDRAFFGGTTHWERRPGRA